MMYQIFAFALNLTYDNFNKSLKIHTDINKFSILYQILSHQNYTSIITDFFVVLRKCYHKKFVKNLNHEY